MSKLSSGIRGFWFEELDIGLNLISPGRTITESDVMAFAGLSGDYDQIHTNYEFSKATNYNQPIAHGLLGLSIASGLIARTGLYEGTVMAFREINNWKFSNPMFFGDTIHVDLLIKEKKPMPRMGGGLVKIQINVINQREEVVMKGIWTALILSKPDEE